MAYERMTSEQIQIAAAQIRSVDELNAHIDGAREVLRVAQREAEALLGKVHDVQASIAQIDRDFVAAGNEVAEMWRDTPPSE